MIAAKIGASLVFFLFSENDDGVVPMDTSEGSTDLQIVRVPAEIHEDKKQDDSESICTILSFQMILF